MRVIRGLVLVLLLIGGKQATATVIFIDAPERVDAGSNFGVSIDLLGLEPGVSVGAFQFTFEISDSSLANYVFSSFSFGGALGDNLAGESIAEYDPLLPDTSVFVFEVSLLTPTQLLDMQNPLGGSFTLFSFELFAIDFDDPVNRLLDLNLTGIVLSDGFGNVINTNSAANRIVTIVPEPSTLALLFLGMIGVAGLIVPERRARSRARARPRLI